MSTLDDKFGLDAEAMFLETEVLRTSEIEGVKLHPQFVRSSVARKLGLEEACYHSRSQYEDGMVEVLVDATTDHNIPASCRAALWGGHEALFPTGTPVFIAFLLATGGQTHAELCKWSPASRER